MGENNVDIKFDTKFECKADFDIPKCDGQQQIQKRNYQSLQEGTTTETEKPVKKHKKVKVSDHTIKNPVSILNEMYKGLKYNFIQQKGPSNNPIFTVEVELNGNKYQSQGRSKSLAKHRVAKKILEILDPAKFCKDDSDSGFGSEGNGSIGGEDCSEQNPVSVLNELRSGLKYVVMEQHGPSHAPTFKISVEVDGQSYFGVGRSKKLAKCAAAEEALKSFIQFQNNKRLKRGPDSTNCDFSLDQFETKKKPAKKLTPEQKGPVMQLNEAFPNAEYECIDTERDLQFRYEVTVQINGRKFSGTGSSKKFAKKAAAATALMALLDIHTPVINNTSPGIRRTNISAQEQEKADHIGRLVNEKFMNLMADDLMHAKRKVLAGVVQMNGADLSSAKVIAITTGTKCISGSYMSMNGTALNDLHAEIAARRCLISYLYDQLTLLLSSETAEESIFCGDGIDFYQLKPDVEFHLYINTAPCGDARIFSPHEDAIGGDKHPNRISRGQLRTKIESGEGTIPVKSHSPVQTWDGVLQGERLLTMSCSDKICKWNVLGIQGSLLSNLIQPIYFKSVVLGSLLHETHLYRAIYGRIENTLQGLPPPFMLNRPPAYLITSTEVRYPTKAPSFAVIWVYGDAKVEIVNTENGKLEGGGISKLCKNTLMSKYHNLATNLPLENCLPNYESKVYCEAKLANENYLVARKALYESFQKAGLGNWVTKPIEQDMFQLPEPSPEIKEDTEEAEEIFPFNL
ncbi:double-stranded RNA-specific editase Adar isoform X1 [Harmonia axyridis]|uniref:double-stranded RNA-specific editase Adar isoform X1 n=1 Tax=Harmonia axyridis TaxID=115357 RepID=UPI001E276E42|nr:double-stranded RNA-specific editase Adar isoform X1 [Harmonia axyridis]